MQNPKALLLQLSTRLNSAAPKFVISKEKSDGHWLCTCTISALTSATGSIGDSCFTGEAVNKKLAALAAADKAWRALKESGVAEILEPPTELSTVVTSALASKVPVVGPSFLSNESEFVQQLRGFRNDCRCCTRMHTLKAMSC